MVEEKIVEEIYNVLVERFGISEVFLPRWGKIRPHSILWKQFIKAALELKAEELAIYCGYSSRGGFTNSMQRYQLIMKDKSARLWFTYFSSLINKKYCSSCKLLLEHNNFAFSSHTRDGFNAKCRSCDKEYYQENRPSILEQRKDYLQKNKKLINSYKAKRRAIKLQAMPTWADQEKIKQIYVTRPEGYHVDHVIPLQHPLVCGLHCEFNLQHLPAIENLSKYNKFDIDKQE
jgi:hypothetical protein